VVKLNRLKVSLTKNGYHKIWKVIKDFPINEVLENTDGGVPDVHIDLAQARGILCGDDQNRIPIEWEKVKNLGDDAIRNLVFIAIIYSHNDLINELKKSKTSKYKGILRRMGGLTEKAYTNFVYTMEEYGFISNSQHDQITYDLSNIFHDPSLAPLARKVIEYKLEDAGWDREENFFDACNALAINDVLSVDKVSFKSWLNQIPILEEKFEISDADLDQKENIEFIFNPGNNLGKTKYSRATRATNKLVDKKHVRIQNCIYEELSLKYGKDNVGTEVNSGYGTPIDIVLKQKEGFVFYEIKTDKTIKKSIRAALSQLLEYNYWGRKEGQAKQLVIVSTAKTASNAKSYFQFLREKCNIPIFYQRFNDHKEKLEELE